MAVEESARALREDGFALPITIFVVTLVTLMLAAVFVRVQVDRRIGESSGDIVDALAIAQSGLQTYLGLVNFDACDKAIRPPNGDSVRINVNGGYADVVAHVVQRPLDTLATWMYIVRSTGRLIEPTQGADPQAVRTVAQFAQWQRNHIDVLAAFTAANGLASLGGSTGEFNGIDQAPAGCQDPNVAAVRVPAGEAPGFSGYTLNGAIPNVVESGTGQQVANATNIAWLATITGGVVPDYTSIVFETTYPTILVTGDVILVIGNTNRNGTGLLIVTGKLVIEGGARLQWDGVVLVGGMIDFDAKDQRFDGIVISGLNEQTGVSPGKTEGGDRLDIVYNSDEVRQALRSVAGFAPITNGWVDNWASY